MLIDLIGPVGGKLHTGRSRNDQVATDMHLFLKKRVQEAIDLIVTFQQTLLDKAQEHIETMHQVIRIYNVHSQSPLHTI